MTGIADGRFYSRYVFFDVLLAIHLNRSSDKMWFICLVIHRIILG